MTVDGVAGPKSEQALTVRLEGDVKVLAADENGHVAKLSCTVGQCLKDGKPLLEPGTVVTAERKDKTTVYTVKGEAAQPDVAQALKLVLTTSNADERNNDDQMMGTDKPQKVGGTWAVDSEKAAAFLATLGFPITKENVKGTSKLAAVKKIDGNEVLKIESEIVLENLAGDGPGGTVIESGNMTFHLEGLFPVDPDAARAQEASSMEAKVRLKGQTPDNKVALVDIQTSLKRTQTYAGYKHGPAAP